MIGTISSQERFLGLRVTMQEGTGEDCILGSFVICTPDQIIFG
jgi:hypothetical protein